MGDAWTSQTPLRNADFKALLATPRPAHLQQKTPRHQKKEHSSQADGEKKQKFKKPAPKPRPGKQAEDKEKEEGPLYRDRAKERREGVSVDFADAEQELASRGLGPGALQHLSIEQSKFLGGDIAHTHLVKGLDYALLHQERQKLEAEKAKAAEAPTAAAAAAAKGAGMLPRGVAGREQQQQPVQFQTQQGRAVYDALFRPPLVNRALVREMFQPRRTAFVFEFGEDAGDVPTTLRRSKADCPAVQDLLCAASDGAVLERIAKIMGYIQASGSGKGGKRGERDSAYIRSILAGVNPAAGNDAQVHGQLVMKGQSAITAGAGKGPAAAAAAGGAGPDDDDDIFGEAGTDYVPALPQKKGEQVAEPRRPDGGYFQDREHLEDLQQPAAAAGAGQDVDMDIEEGELPGSKPAAEQQEQQQQDGSYGQHTGQYQQGWQQQQQQQLQQYGSQYGQYGQPAAQPQQEMPKWRVVSKPGQELKGFDDDAYAECFPSMMMLGVAEDDEEPLPKGKQAEAGGAEAGGAAAGGKGGKGGRGGAAGGGVDESERKLSQKLNKQVQQMHGIFKEKGWGSEAAFRKQDKLDSVAATPARKRIRL